MQGGSDRFVALMWSRTAIASLCHCRIAIISQTAITFAEYYTAYANVCAIISHRQRSESLMSIQLATFRMHFSLKICIPRYGWSYKAHRSPRMCQEGVLFYLLLLPTSEGSERSIGLLTTRISIVWLSGEVVARSSTCKITRLVTYISYIRFLLSGGRKYRSLAE